MKWPKSEERRLVDLEEVRRIHQEGMLLEVVHVKARRSKKEKQEMLLFERHVTESN